MSDIDEDGWEETCPGFYRKRVSEANGEYRVEAWINAFGGSEGGALYGVRYPDGRNMSGELFGLSASRVARIVCDAEMAAYLERVR